MKTKKIGIMGGTFDPPHIGHLMAAEATADKLKLDKVIFVPTGKIPYKDSTETSSADKRYEMTKLAIADNPLFDISDIETNFDDFSYTFSTIKKLKESLPDSELFFIVGADSLDYMDRWREPEQIFENCSVAAVSREGFSTKEQQIKAEELRAKFDAKIFLVTMPNIGVSSTDIRRRIREGRTVEYMIPTSVKEFIKSNRLYSGR